jgi:hypothetical protein
MPVAEDAAADKRNRRRPAAEASLPVEPWREAERSRDSQRKHRAGAARPGPGQASTCSTATTSGT